MIAKLVATLLELIFSQATRDEEKKNHKRKRKFGLLLNRIYILLISYKDDLLHLAALLEKQKNLGDGTEHYVTAPENPYSDVHTPNTPSELIDRLRRKTLEFAELALKIDVVGLFDADLRKHMDGVTMFEERSLSFADQVTRADLRVSEQGVIQIVNSDEYWGPGKVISVSEYNLSEWDERRALIELLHKTYGIIEQCLKRLSDFVRARYEVWELFE